MKKVCIITTSYRKNGNSNTLASEFARGAKESGNQVEIISLAEKNIAFCRGCLTCSHTHQCVIQDDAVEIAQKMQNADVLVFATPVYYYSVSGQLKTLIDRVNPLYASDYRFRDVYLIACAAEDEKNTVEGTKCAIQGFVDCYEKSRLAGVVFAGGVYGVGDVRQHPVMLESYEMGKRVGL